MPVGEAHPHGAKKRKDGGLSEHFSGLSCLQDLPVRCCTITGDHAMFHIPAHKNTDNPPAQFTPK